MLIGGSFVFIHNPRAAGISISEALGGRTEGVPVHMPRSHITTEAPTFGFIRNPWARQVSLWRFLVRKGRTPPIPFREWLMDGEDWLDEDVQFKQPLECLQRRPQMWWLRGCTHVGRVERIEHDFALICDTLGIEAGELARENAATAIDWRDVHDKETRFFVEKWFTEDIGKGQYSFE